MTTVSLYWQPHWPSDPSDRKRWRLVATLPSLPCPCLPDMDAVYQRILDIFAERIHKCPEGFAPLVEVIES